MTDRELQDDIIRYVTDPQARSGDGALKLSAQQAARAAQFARFLARRYYRDRLGRSFRYSAMLAAGRTASDILEHPDFECLLSAGFLGSFALAQRVAQYAMEWMKQASAANERAWWISLLDYERAHFLQTATSEIRAPAGAPQRGLSAACVHFDCDMAELLRLIKTKQTIAEGLRRAVTLLFSRTRGGRIYVMEVDAATAAIFGAVDGHRDEQTIAHSAGIELVAAQTILSSLIEIGAVIAPSAENDKEQFLPERVLGI
jgi:hypothetical protein